MSPPYPAAIALGFFSALIVLLITPPLWWHIKNKNIGAAAVIAWLVVLNFMSFLNTTIWPNDDLQNSFQGQGLCDIEVKLQVASQVALPAAFACILRALARVMNTKKTALGRTSSQQKWDMFVELSWCVGFPALQMFLHYVVQPRRYYIFGISGCDPSVSTTWATVWLINVPPVFWTLICALYSVLILVRLHRHRKSIKHILETNDTNKSRFIRLFALCILWIFGNVPIQFYVFKIALSIPRDPYSWSDVHDPDQLSQILMIPSFGVVLYDRYIWLSAGAAMFVFFGFGREAVTMYKSLFRLDYLAQLWPKKWQRSTNKRGSSDSQTHLTEVKVQKSSLCSTTVDSWSEDIEMGSSKRDSDV